MGTPRHACLGNARHAEGKTIRQRTPRSKKNHPLPQPTFIPVTIPNPRSLSATHVTEARWEKRIAGNAFHLQKQNSGNARHASLKRGFGILKTVPPTYLVH
jgi:queuine/archaeosine tRNA-ribosyltransferase